MYPCVLYQYPELAGETFMPSNGTEGMGFTAAFCENCIHEKFSHTQNHADRKCDIMSRAIIHWYDIDNRDYPRQWQFDSRGWPVCTAWQKWDWGNDGDPADPDNPKYILPEDPAQLCFPWDIMSLLGIDGAQLIVTQDAIIERDAIEL